MVVWWCGSTTQKRRARRADGRGQAPPLHFLEKLDTAGNLTTDAHLAALTIEHQAELHTTDTDFARFGGLKWRNPIRER